jgi:hypothetical protein
VEKGLQFGSTFSKGGKRWKKVDFIQTVVRETTKPMIFWFPLLHCLLCEVYTMEKK